MSDRIAWPLYLALCAGGMAMVFVGIAARDAMQSTLSGVITAGGGIMVVLGVVLWWRALIRRHGPGRMLICLVLILAVLFVIGLLFQRFVEDGEREVLPVTAVIERGAEDHLAVYCSIFRELPSAARSRSAG